VGWLGSAVWVSASFQCLYTCRIYSINMPFAAILPAVPVAQYENACYDASMPHVWSSIPARATICIIFSYLLHSSIYCNKQFIQFNVYCNHH